MIGRPAAVMIALVCAEPSIANYLLEDLNKVTP